MHLPLTLPSRLPPNPVVYRWVVICALIASLATTGQDYLSALGRQGSYYFSESLLFSSFWWIFPPLLWIQLRHAGRLASGTITGRLWWMIWPMAAHLLLYPAVVDALARLTLGHGYRWTQTLAYGISQYAVALILGYSVSLLTVLRPGIPARDDAEAEVTPQTDGSEDVHAAAHPVSPTGFLDTIMAKEGSRTLIVPVGDVMLFTAASPYVRLHGARRQFLVTGTLRSLSLRLDPARFCRIHKSAIVQLEAVVEMRSRQNGDYDLILADGSATRLSRSYVAAFRKALVSQGHLPLLAAGKTTP